MDRIAFIVFKEEEADNDKTDNSKARNFKPWFLRILMQKIFRIVNKTKNSREIKIVDLFDDENINILSVLLPFEIKDLEKKAETIKNKISGICSTNKIDKCIIPIGSAEKFIDEGNYLFQAFSGKILFKSLLVLIIEEICRRKEMMINEADISIVHGNNAGELITFTRILSPYIRYLTLVTGFSNEIEDEIDKLYAESGLAISITSDINRGIKNKDIVINLGSMERKNLDSKINQNAWIINYGSQDINKSNSKNIIINGIKINLTENIKRKTEDIKNMNLLYESSHIAEALIYYKLQKYEAGLSFQDDNELYDNMAREFIRMGFKIEGLIGRHGLVDLN
ncbi:MAG TPA: hypothetical protein GXX20_01420 [Clostridiaceae bacterium]|nr:hypothetical protein [Clostridiaceae bacterium]